MSETMRNRFQRRSLTGPEVAGLVVVAFFILPLLIAGGFWMVTAISTWPAVIGLVTGAVGALLVQRTLALEAVAGRQRIAELEHENAQLTRQVRQLEATVDQFINHDEEQQYRP